MLVALEEARQNDAGCCQHVIRLRSGQRERGMFPRAWRPPNTTEAITRMTLAPSSTDLAKLSLFATLMGPREAQEDADKTGKLWHITIIKAGRALTGDEYPAEVLRDSLDIFKGLPIYSFRFGEDAADDPNGGFHHLPEEAGRDPRGQPTGNLIGQVTEEVWWNEAEQAIEALAAIDDSKIRDRLRNAFARGAIGKGAELDVFGFSIFAEVLKKDARVAKFVKGNSLDLVTRPAAGGAFVSIVAEAPRLSFVETLRAETDLDESAVVAIAVEELEARAQGIIGHAEKTKDQKRAALAALAFEVVGSLRDGELGTRAQEHIKAASAAIDDQRKQPEDDMDAKAIAKLVGETVSAELAKVKAEGEAAAIEARGANPLDELKVWLESLQGEERMTALQQVKAMLSTLGAIVEDEGAGLGAEEFASLAAELQAATEEKDAKGVRARLAKVVEGLNLPGEKSSEQRELERMRSELRNAAITLELDKLTPELKLVDSQAALVLADISGVTVNGMEVAGLRESLEAVIASKPYLVQPAQAEELETDADAPSSDELAKAKAEAEAAATKSAELQMLSAATIRESVGAGGIAAIPDGLAGRIKDLQMRARQGDTWAALEYGRIRQKLIGGTV